MLDTYVCQAMDDRSPSHPAEVVCDRDGLQWFSCRPHAPKSVKVVTIREWNVSCGLLPELPTVIVEREGNQYVFSCEHCKARHRHGAASLGHRIAHCDPDGASPYLKTGYLLSLDGTD